MSAADLVETNRFRRVIRGPSPTRHPMRQSNSLACILLLASTALCACSTTVTRYARGCHVRIDTMSPTEASPGESVTLVGGPYTSLYDTALLVGSTRVTPDAVTRDPCEACDDCFEREECLLCTDCDECDADCADCVESVVFTVPSLPPGTHDVRLLNRHGESNAVPLRVEGDDTGTDTSTEDSPPDDSGKDTSGKDTSGKDTSGKDDTSPKDTTTGHTGGDDSASDDTGK
jgi:hypothetical protein